MTPWPVMPLGLCYIATSLEAQGYEVRVSDLCFVKKTQQFLMEEIKQFQPDAIGISIRNIDNVNLCHPFFYLESIRESVFKVCQRYSEAPIILGGPAIGIAPELIMDYFGADYAIAGEGEQAILDWLQFLQHQKFFKNFYYRAEDQKIAIPQMHSLPYRYPIHPQPFKWIRYLDYLKKGASVNIQSKRGCVFNCLYCSYNQIEGHHYRLRDPVDVIDEVEEWLFHSSPKCFEFVDSTFNSPQSHAIKICEEIIRRSLKTSFTTMGLNPGCLSLELLQTMKASGFHQGMCSPDSASPLMLENLQKNFDLDDLKKSVELFKKVNLRIFWFFILGGPGETKETVEETLNFCKKYIAPEDVIHFTIGFRVFPNTPLEKFLRQQYSLEGADLFFYPKFYCSPEIAPTEILKMIHQEAKRFSNFITYLDMELYDRIKQGVEFVFPQRSVDHNWEKIPSINKNLNRLHLWNWFHKKQQRNFKSFLQSNSNSLFCSLKERVSDVILSSH